LEICGLTAEGIARAIKEGKG